MGVGCHNVTFSFMTDVHDQLGWNLTVMKQLKVKKMIVDLNVL